MLENHGGRVEPSVHYLVAVLGNTGDLPVSADIGGLPQVILDESDSPASSVVVDLEDKDVSGTEEKISDVCEDIEHPNAESLPMYGDIDSHPEPPPSYDSLQSPHTSIPEEHDSAEDVVPSRQNNMFNLAQKVRARRRRKKGYYSCGT